MSQQLQITGGAKVRDLNDVIIGTSGVLSSLAFNVANGVPKLDSNAKILVSQLPNSVMEYLGTWNAATNTPFLVNGTGNAGDVYLCNVAGTVDFGAGPISFVVSDQVIYSGSIWQKASGSNGTVTSIGLSSTGNDAITITGSPVTTSGTINLGFAGTNLQYINGAGDLTTFPTLISSIGLSMPSAFNVSNSPLTANGTIGVTGAGVASQYIRGDGTLADFPTSGGGGSSVSYYLNGGTSQGTIGGVTYYEMSKTADTGTGVDFPLVGNGLIVSFLTDAGDPAQLNIPAGNWNYEIYASMSSNGGTPQLYAELYVYDGTTFTLISTSSNEILYDGVNLNLYTFAMAVPATTLALTDRLAIKLYATNSGGKTTTVHTQDSHLCQVITTFSTGITALNGLTAQVQYFATGTSGTDFNISSTTATHTFNIPSASATNRGLITTGSQTIAGDKAFTGINSFDYGINYKTGASLANVSGYISQAYATSGTGAGSTLSLKISDGNSVKAINLDFVGSPATYTYTFPNFSGTVALLEGTQTFTGLKTFGDSIQAGYGISLYNGIGTGALVSATYTGFYASKSGTYTNITFAHDGAPYFSRLKLLNNATYDYTFPAASGTISLLESTQTFTGVNTFSGLTSFTFSSGTRMDYGPYLTKGSVPTVFSGTTTNIYSDVTTNNIVIRDTSSIAKLLFDNSTQTYTFPAATGTIALTSNLSSYVPYTGATANLNMGTGSFGINAGQFLELTKNGSDSLGSSSNIGFTNAGGTDAVYIQLNTNNDLSFFGKTSGSSTGPLMTFLRTGILTIGSTTALAATYKMGVTGTGGGYVAKSTGVSDANFYSSSSTIGNHFYADKPSLGAAVFYVNLNGGGYFKDSIGINVTPNSTYILDVNGTGRFSSQLNGTSAVFSGNISSTSATIFAKSSGTEPLNYQFSAITLGFDATNNIGWITAGGSASRTNLILQEGGGSVGIGTRSPSGAAGVALVLNSGVNQGRICIKTSSTGDASGDGLQIGMSGTSAFIEQRENDDLTFSTNASEKVRITSVGYVGIGTTPNTILNIKSSTTTELRLESVGGTYRSFIGFRTDGQKWDVGVNLNDANDALSFNYVGSERMRITNGGELSLNNTSTTGRFNIYESTAKWAQIINHGRAGVQYMIQFQYNGSEVGAITSNNSNITYSTSSDYRLKQDLKDFNGLDLVSKLNVYDFAWKIDNSKRMYGVIAHEMAEVLPYAVNKEKDLIKENGKIDPQGVDYSLITPLLVKAIQELEARIKQLENK